MYLHNLIIENMGAIERCELLEKDLLKDDGTPRIIVLVGQNGSGKTTLLSSIVDAFHEFANDSFDNVLPKHGLGYRYFKITGLTNQKINTEYGFNYLQFKIDSQVLEYIDKGGKLSFSECKAKTNNLLTINSQWDDNKNLKKHTNVNNDETFKNTFLGNCYCYFPSDRYEYPYWLGSDIIKFDEQLSDPKSFSNSLNKPIIIRKSLQEVKNWILDVFLDQNFEVNVATDNTNTEMTKVKIFDVTIKNIEHIISEIVGQSISLGINLRVHNSSRLKLVDKQNRDFLPSLNNLSAGQSTLLSIFINMVMQSENINIMNSIALQQISGIVLIDEIDLHLHIHLQKEVLPQLIKMFPNVQFILTAHSPFFLNGMDKVFDKNDYLVVNMPTGKIINYDEFEEFNKAYEVFDTLTNDYKEEINVLKSLINESTKPLVITEGKTDKKLLETAWNKLYDDSMPFEVISSGIEIKEEERSGNANEVMRTLQLISNMIKAEQIVIGLFDNDKEGNEQYKGLSKKIFEEYNISKNIRKHKEKNIYGMLLSVPEFRQLFVTEDDMLQRYFVMEHYFKDEILEVNSMKGTSILGTEVFKVNNGKDTFAGKVDSLNKEDFENFHKLFEDILKVINP